MYLFAIIIAAIGALGLAVGTHLQHHAVRAAAPPDSHGSRTAAARAFTRPRWLIGMGIIVVATILNVVALGFAPIALVQPIGSLALVGTVIISAIVLGIRVRRELVVGIGITLASVAAFVSISAVYVREVPPADANVAALTWALLALSLAGAFVARRFDGHLVRVVAAGTIFGTVAATAHVIAGEVVARISGPDSPISAALPTDTVAVSQDSFFNLEFWTLVVLLAVASLVGAWLVQTAYASGPPETVLAGLTVIDPIVAVLVGALLLGEYTAIPFLGLLGLLLSGAMACAGIAVIARHHPTGGLASPPPPRVTAAPPTTFEASPRELDSVAIQNRRS